MKVIIAGDRDISEQNFKLIDAAISASKFKITAVVSGTAKGGDKLGEKWASVNGVRVTKFPAKWKELDAPGALVKEGEYGKYNARAGFDRNQEMADYADALIALQPDGPTDGISDMITRAKAKGIPVFIYPEVYERTSEFCYTF